MTRIQVERLDAAVPEQLPEELCEVLAAGQSVRIERIVSRGHTAPASGWFDQPWDEFVYLAKGRARLLFEEGGTEVPLEAGQWLLIPAGRRHRVSWTDPEQDCLWLAVHFRGDSTQPSVSDPVTD